MDAGAISAGAATVLAAGQLVPQVVRLRRAGVTTGLSPVWVLLGVAINAGWVAYRWSGELWWALPSPIIAGALYLVILRFVLRNVPDLKHARRVLLAWLALAGAVTMLGGRGVVSMLLGVSGIAQAAPAVSGAFRTAEPLGVAPGLWIVGLGQALLWGHYGWLNADQALVLYGVTTAIVAAAILIRYATTVASGRAVYKRSMAANAAPMAPASEPRAAGTMSISSSGTSVARRRVAVRIGPRMASPAAAMPPPITTRSGPINVIALAIAIPRYSAACSTASTQRGSPSATPSNTSATDGRPAAAASTSERAIASAHPGLPHPQMRPSGATVWWAISPAIPVAP